MNPILLLSILLLPQDVIWDMHGKKAASINKNESRFELLFDEHTKEYAMFCYKTPQDSKRKFEIVYALNDGIIRSSKNDDKVKWNVTECVVISREADENQGDAKLLNVHVKETK